MTIYYRIIVNICIHSCLSSVWCGENGIEMSFKIIKNFCSGLWVKQESEGPQVPNSLNF